MWSVLACGLWCAAAGRAARGARALRLLKDQNPEPPARWPRLSVLIPARDEAGTLEVALKTLLAQDYPDLEIVLVNDRSTDGTDRVVDELAAGDPRVRPIHVRQLPEGWLGKIHALELARRGASGDWLLFTDADVHFAPGTLKEAIAFSLAGNLDHLAVIPTVRARGFWLRVTMTAGALATILKLPIEKVGRPDSDMVLGAGAFNLVRTARLERTEGLEWMRMEVPDDYALAVLLQRAGAKTTVLGGADRVRLTWYPSLGALVRRMDKSFYAVRYSYLRLSLVAGLAGWFLAGPAVALLATEVRVLWFLAVLSYVLLALSGVAVGRKLGWPAWPGLLLPVGLAVMTYGLLRGGFNCWRRGGLIWRDTLYPVEQLRASQRIKL